MNVSRYFFKNNFTSFSYSVKYDYKFIKLFLREGQRWDQNPSEKNIAGKKHEKMPQYFARLIVSLSSQVVVQFQILVTLYLYSVS